MFKNLKINQDLSYSEKISLLKDLIDKSDAVVIGAGSGLSTSAGLMYTGERFYNNFSDFIAEYGFSDMYSAAFYPFKTQEEKWAYFSKHILLNRYTELNSSVYSNLFSLVKDKNYFVLTTNVDHLFQKNSFSKNHLFYTQGDYGLFQCSVPCSDNTYDNYEIILKMVKEQKDFKIPTDLIPKCPICKSVMTTNLRADSKFVQDEGWYKAANNYKNFINENKDKNILFLELGVGYNTPSIIKYPFWQMTNSYKNALMVCVDYSNALVHKDIEHKAICIQEDIKKVLEDIIKN